MSFIAALAEPYSTSSRLAVLNPMPLVYLSANDAQKSSRLSSDSEVRQLTGVSFIEIY
jgi:hypothetical protein